MLRRHHAAFRGFGYADDARTRVQSPRVDEGEQEPRQRRIRIVGESNRAAHEMCRSSATDGERGMKIDPQAMRENDVNAMFTDDIPQPACEREVQSALGLERQNLARQAAIPVREKPRARIHHELLELRAQPGEKGFDDTFDTGDPGDGRADPCVAENMQDTQRRLGLGSSTGSEARFGCCRACVQCELIRGRSGIVSSPEDHLPGIGSSSFPRACAALRIDSRSPSVVMRMNE